MNFSDVLHLQSRRPTYDKGTIKKKAYFNFYSINLFSIFFLGSKNPLLTSTENLSVKPAVIRFQMIIENENRKLFHIYIYVFFNQFI